MISCELVDAEGRPYRVSDAVSVWNQGANKWSDDGEVIEISQDSVKVEFDGGSSSLIVPVYLQHMVRRRKPAPAPTRTERSVATTNEVYKTRLHTHSGAPIASYEAIQPMQWQSEHAAHTEQSVLASPEPPKTLLQTYRCSLEASKTPLQTCLSTAEAPKTPVQTYRFPPEASRTPVQTYRCSPEVSKTPVQTYLSTAEAPKMPVQTNRCAPEAPKTPVQPYQALAPACSPRPQTTFHSPRPQTTFHIVPPQRATWQQATPRHDFTPRLSTLQPDFTPRLSTPRHDFTPRFR